MIELLRSAALGWGPALFVLAVAPFARAAVPVGVGDAAARSLKLYDIVPYALGDEDRTAEDILRTHRETGLDTFLYSVSLDPRGCPAFGRVTAATASYRKIGVRLAGNGVKWGFLLQSIVGHWPRVDREIEPWQRSVNGKGQLNRFCVLDERYRAYIRRTGAALASEHPCFILGDDDIRAPEECFCPLHVAEFNRRTGLNLSAEQLRAAVSTCVVGDKVCETFLGLRREIPLTVMRELRKGIDSVDASIPTGTCMPFSDNFTVLEWAKVMSSGHPLTLRLANGLYCEYSSWTFAEIVLRTLGYLALYRDRVDVLLDEADTFPHTLYARSGRTFHAKLAMSFFSGLDGAKLWFVGMHKGSERVPEAYDRDFERYGRFYEALHAVARDSSPSGIRIPVFFPTDMHPTRHNGSGMYARHDWAQTCFALYGVPFYADEKTGPDGVLLLEGEETVARLSDADLKNAFSGRLFVDGAASRALARRGFATELGCRPSDADLAYNIETVCESGESPPIMKGGRMPPLVGVSPQAEVFSELRYSENGLPAEAKTVSAGAVLFANPSGGKVFTSSFSVPCSHCSLNQRRKRWLTRALRKLDPQFPVVSSNEEPNLTLARRMKDGRTVVLTINMCPDDMPSLAYETVRDPVETEVLQPDGTWRSIACVRAGTSWRLPVSLPPFGVSVLRWR